ncbi:MAG: GldG family protein [Panacagrimonas sp.]
MKQKNKNLLQQLLNGALILAAIVMLGWLSVRYNVKQDWTFNQRNTLTEPSRLQLASMKDPIRFIAFAYPGAPERPSIQFYVDQYKRFKKDVELEFIDPSSQPLQVKKYDVSFAGEVVLEYQGRRESLRALSEQNITGALQRLSFSGEKLILFLDGHGERSVTESQDQNSFAKFAEVLKDKGLSFKPWSLIKMQGIPDNTAVLVIASPRGALLEGEVKLIDDYVKRGGNLLWLADPDNPPGLAALADTLAITWQNGYVVFPEYELLGTGHPGIFVALDYPPSPVTRGLDQVTVFPLVRSLKSKPGTAWTAQPILTSSEGAWLEAQPMSSDTVSLDPMQGDIPGPLTIGMALTRDLPDPDAPPPTNPAEGEEPAPAATRQQRVVLVGDADFLSDGTLSQLGNQHLGLNIVQWLASRDSQINIDVPNAPDTQLFLPNWALILIGAGFVIVLPLLLIGTGVTRWILRRRR